MKYGEALAGEQRNEGAVPVMSSGGVTGSHDQANTRAPAIVVGRKGSHGSVFWSDSPAFVIDTAFSIDASNTECDLRWLYWVLISLNLNAISNDVGVPGLSREAAYDSRLVDVPLSEQRRIADFLDDRIARIDRIIAARQEQTARLTSLFESRVTESIDAAGGSRCPLWMMTARITDGAHVSPETDDGVFHFVSTRDVSAIGSIDFSGALKTSRRSYEELVRYGCRPRPGDVLFSKDGTVGRTARVTEGREFVVASSLIIIRPDPDLLDYNYLHFLCKHAEFVHQVDAYVKGAGLPRISISNLRRVEGVFPAVPIQRQLALRLDEELACMLNGVERLAAAAERLTEYKQSLITAAVTGELDVTTASSGIPG